MTPEIKEAYRQFAAVCKPPEGYRWQALVITAGGQDLYALALRYNEPENLPPFLHDKPHMVEEPPIWRPADLYCAWMVGIATAFSTGILVKANSDRILGQHPEWRELQQEFVQRAAVAYDERDLR